MKTVVIHPKDRSTDFLKKAYEGQDVTVITEWVGNQIEFIEYLKQYDRIIGMGHGSPGGLFSIGKFNGLYSLSELILYSLRNKRMVFVWCNSDLFVKGTKIFRPELYTGMIISEVSEANWEGIRATQAQVDESNRLFAQGLADGLFVEQSQVLEQVKKSYCSIKTDNPVILFNQQRIYGF